MLKWNYDYKRIRIDLILPFTKYRIKIYQFLRCRLICVEKNPHSSLDKFITLTVAEWWVPPIDKRQAFLSAIEKGLSAFHGSQI